MCIKKSIVVNINARKMYTIFQRMDSCKYSIEIFIVPLKERIPATSFFETDMQLLKELLIKWITTSSPVKVWQYPSKYG